MDNPWIHISESDYVGHMNSPAVNQRPFLNQALHDALLAFRPASVLILGCSNGNGLEHVDPSVTSKVVAVDINPLFLRSLSLQFPHPDYELDVSCSDLMEYNYESERFDLVHAALVFEYLHWEILLPRIAKSIRPNGFFSVILQCPSETIPAITPSEFTTLHSLEKIFHFVHPEELINRARAAGFELVQKNTNCLSSGKVFEIIYLVKMVSSDIDGIQQN